MSKQDPILEAFCWDCGARNDPTASECWLCQRQDWLVGPGTRGTLSARSGRTRGPLSTIAGWMALIAVIAVAAAIFRQAPGLAVLLFVSVVPALLFTEVKARRRQRRGWPMSPAERAAWFLGMTFLIPIVLGMALFAALFLFCLFVPR